MCTLESSVLSLDFSDILVWVGQLIWFTWTPEKDIKHSIFLNDMLNYLTSGKSQYILTSSISSFIPGFNINLKQMSWSIDIPYQPILHLGCRSLLTYFQSDAQ